MTEELNIKQFFSEFIHFISRNKKTITSFIALGIILVVLFQNLKPSYYDTQAICMSGISEYERLEQLEELSQRTAVDLINYLQINIYNKDYSELASLLNVSKETAAAIKHIEAEQLYQQDMNEKFYALNKFEIRLSVFDNTTIDTIQKGLIFYFNNNNFIKEYHKMYKTSNNRLVDDITQEIIVLSRMRVEGAKNNLDLSSVNIISGKEGKELSNQIISLSQLREDIQTNQELLKPLVYVQEFAEVNKKEDDIVIWGILVGFISFIIGIFVAQVKEIKDKS